MGITPDAGGAVVAGPGVVARRLLGAGQAQQQLEALPAAAVDPSGRRSGERTGLAIIGRSCNSVVAARAVVADDQSREGLLLLTEYRDKPIVVPTGIVFLKRGRESGRSLELV